MKVIGSHVLHAPRQQVWDALQDPAVLVRTIPGCHELAEVDDHTYVARVSAGIASIKGTYEGRVALSDQDPPTGYTLRATGSGAPGTIDATATIRLTEDADGNTQVDYDADAVIGGAVGGVGQRVLTGVARRNATAFFEAVDRHLAGEVDALPATPDVSVDGTAPVARQRPAVHRREPATAPAPDVAQLLLAALIGAAIALLGVVVGRRTQR
ncbi:MAG TPA: carbon monoxide dehydrogenase subunit G [Euzebyales bacterium]|nr:carbon monoxide dehydrogenase subunit G [Euzebyales bacterium]